MIKFKKIIEKAGGLGGARGRATLLMGIDRRRGAPEAPPPEAEGTPREAAQAAAAETEDLQTQEIQSPPAPTDASPAAEDSPGTEFEVGTELMDSVLGDMFAGTGEKEAPDEAVRQEDNQQVSMDAEISESDQPAETAAAEDEPQAGDAEDMSDADGADEGVSAAETDGLLEQEQASAEVEQADATEDLEAVEEPSEEAQESESGLGTEFMAEVDQLLAKFGQFDAGAVEGAPAAEDAEESPEAAIEDALSEAAEVANAVAGISEGSAEPTPGEAGADDELAGLEASVEAAAATVETPVEPSDETPESAAEQPAPAPPVKEPLLETLTEEEKAALFAEDYEPEAPPEGNGLESRSEEKNASDGKPQDTAEVKLDFTPSSVGIEEPREEGEVEELDTDELLSKVLADLDNLGVVEKEAQEKSKDAPEEEEDGTPDFSQILAEVSPTDSMPSKPVEEPAPPEPPPPPAGETTPKPAAADKEAPREEPIPPENTEAETISQEDILNQLLAEQEESEDDEEDELPDEDGLEEPSSEGDDESEGRPDDAGDVLADLVASTNASEEETQRGVPDGDGGETEDKDDLTEEELIRREVLSRSKDVEQKVLDDVFGSDESEFESEIKTEMAQVEEHQRQLSQGTSALSEEAARLAEEKEGSNEGPRQEFSLSGLEEAAARVRFSLHWLAYQMNRPFRRWLDPAARRALTLVSLCFIGTSFTGLVAALLMRWMGQ